MPTVTEYDFQQVVNYSQTLMSAIQASSIVTALDYINTTSTTVSVFFKDVLSTADQATLIALMASYVDTPPPTPATPNITATPYDSKVVVINGIQHNLYKRFTGISQALASGANTFTWTQANYSWVQFLGIEVIGGELGDTCSLYILDTATGTYSGTPNAPLNQFGFNVNIAPGFYIRDSRFEADIYQGLQFKFVYNSVSNKTIYLNFDMNQVD